MLFQHGSKNIRLKKYDYHSGWFFITNKSNYSSHIFKEDIYDLVRNELFDISKKTKGVTLDYFHIMSNHIHVILGFNESDISLSEFWRRYKAITTLKAKRNDFNGQTLWQKGFHEHIIRNEAALQRIRKYIQNNPLKEDLPLREIYQDIKYEIEN